MSSDSIEGLAIDRAAYGLYIKEILRLMAGDHTCLNAEKSPSPEQPDYRAKIQASIVTIIRNEHSKWSQWWNQVHNAMMVTAVQPFNVLVCGPKDAGKSELISCCTSKVAGDKPTPHAMADRDKNMDGLSIQEKPAFYQDNHGVRWYNTCGLNEWTVSSVQSYWNEHVTSTRCLPKVAIFVMAPGSVISNSAVVSLLKTLIKNHIPVIYVLSKWTYTDTNDRPPKVAQAIAHLLLAKEYTLKQLQDTKLKDRPFDFTGSFQQTVRGIAVQSKAAIRMKQEHTLASANSSPPPECFITCVNSRLHQTDLMDFEIAGIGKLRELIVESLSDTNFRQLCNIYKDNYNFLVGIWRRILAIPASLVPSLNQLMLSAEELDTYQQLMKMNE